MNDEIVMLCKMFIIFIVMILLSVAIYDYYKEHYGYEYVNFYDEHGISEKCVMNDDGLFCKTKGGLIGVKQFRKR